MSRGPGRWQRALLDALEVDDVVVVNRVTAAVVGPDATRATHVAFRHAARRLAEEGRVRAFYRMAPTADGRYLSYHLAVARPTSTAQGDPVPITEPAWIRPERPAETDPTTGPSA